MTRIFDRRSTLVFVIAVLALVVAMSSTAAYAAVARNSVVSKSIKNGQVKTPDLAAGAVTSAKLRDGNVTAPDLANGAVTSAKIADGTVTGGDLAEAAVGAQHLTRIETVTALSSATADADGVINGGDFGLAQATANCPAGWTPISGGANWANQSNGSMSDKNVYLQATYGVGGGWYARGIVDIGAQGTVQLQVHVRCLEPWPQAVN